jgi:hypothetical protein
MTTHEEREAALIPLLTPEFLATLREAVRVIGWSVDAVESAAFAEALHQRAGAQAGDLSPYEDDEEEEKRPGE